MIFYESAMLTINYRLCKVEMKEQHNDFTKISLIFAEKLINARLQFVKGKNERADARPMTNHSATI